MNTEQDIHFTDGSYRGALINAVDTASNRLLLEVMNVDHLGGMDKVLQSTLRARKRGVEVLMVYDRYSYPTVLLKYGPKALAAVEGRLRELEHAGAMIKKVGARGINPFAGRHHAKAVIADDTIFVGGGANLTHDTFATKDFMLEFQSPEMADTLYRSLPEAAHERHRDKVIFNDGMNRFLLDGGTRRSSLIYDTTCKLAEKARRAWYVSKLAPDGRLLEILQQKDSEFWYNTVESASFFDSIAISIDQGRQRVHNLYGLENELHAKFCVFEMPDGSLETITGSHNFNSRGVNFGTQEIALHSKDETLARQLIEFTRTLGNDQMPSKIA